MSDDRTSTIRISLAAWRSCCRCWRCCVLRHAYRQRRARLERLGNIDVVVAAHSAEHAEAAGVADGSPRAGERARRRRGRRSALGRRAHVVRSRGIDMVLSLDASLSMMAEDERPSRLERMKQEVRRLRAMSPGDRMGVLAFAGRSYVLSPLTIDEGALDLFLDNLDPSVVGQAGSSLARTIRQGVDLLDADEQWRGSRAGRHERWRGVRADRGRRRRGEAGREPGNQRRHGRIWHRTPARRFRSRAPDGIDDDQEG